MGNYNFTATTDVRSQNYSSVRAHVERETNEHSNEQIDVSKSHLNRAEVLLDYTSLKKEHYGDYIEKVNKNRRGAKGTVNSKYKSVDDYLRRTDGSCDTTSVQFFGNKDLWDALKDELTSSGMSEQEVVDAIDRGYSLYADGFNRRNEYVKMVKWVSNHDESTPHWHSQLFTQGVSLKGKPLKSIDSALVLQMPHIADSGGKKMNKVRMRAWREQEDTAFFKAVSESLVSSAKANGIDVSIDMYRKNEHNGLTMTQYKNVKKQEELTEAVLDDANSKMVDVIARAFPHYHFGDGPSFGTEEGRKTLSERSLDANLAIVPKLLSVRSKDFKKESDELSERLGLLDEREALIDEKALETERIADDNWQRKQSLDEREALIDGKAFDAERVADNNWQRERNLDERAEKIALMGNDVIDRAARVDVVRKRMIEIVNKISIPLNLKKDLISFMNTGQKTALTDVSLPVVRPTSQQVVELRDDLEL